MKIFILLMSLASFSFAGEADLKKADALFEKSLYQEALDIYAAQTASTGETGLKALYRAAECEGLLSRYGEAAQRFSAVKLPGDPLWRGRFLLLRAELGRLFLSRYALPADIQQGTTDVTKLTGDEWRRRIEGDYDALWDLRAVLAASPIGNEAYFLDLKDAALDSTPSLWDFAVLKWSGYLLEESVENEKTLPDGLKFITENYKSDYSSAAPAAEKAAALFEDAAARSPKSGEAAEEWKIKRFLIPLAHGNRVSVPDPARLRELALIVLTKWSDSMSAPRPRAAVAYEAAVLSSEKQDYKEAVRLCKKAEDLAPRSMAGVMCARLRAQIEMPLLEVTARFAPPPGKGILTVNARNLPKLYFRAYRTDPDSLGALAARPGTGWENLRYLEDKTVDQFLSRNSDLAWDAKMEYPGPYQPSSRDIAGPELKKGLYVIVVSGDPSFQSGSSLMRAVTVNITDILLLGTSGVTGDPEDFLYDPARPSRQTETGVFNLYAVNALTGLPLGDALIDTFYNRGWSKWDRKTLTTGADGTAVFSAPLRVSYPSNENLSIDPLLSSGGSYAYWNGYQNAGLDVPEPLTLYVETDRPVYRPGQEVKYKVTALIREPRGFRAYDGKSKLTVTVRDQNWQELFSKTLPFTGLGSASGSFTVPQGRLLGQYSLTADLREYGNNFSGTQTVRVEEYKRPEFEVTLGAADSAFKYGQTAKVTGSVKYYFGSPVPGAQVTYKVKRSRYIPWYAWWWGGFYGASNPAETASGACKIDEKGQFDFSFIPLPESPDYADYPSSFQVDVEARDAGGRTIADSRSYTAGSKAYLFDISPEAGFFTSDKPAVFKARLMDLNDTPAAGKGSYSVFSIDKTPEFSQSDAQWGSFGHTPSLEQAFSQAPDGKLAQSGTMEFSKKSPVTVKLKALKEGVYRLRLKAKDPWGGDSESWIILVSVNPSFEKSSLVLPPAALFEHASYQAGEKARILIGATELRGVKFLETLAGNFILSKKTIQAGGISLCEIKIGPEHRGGFGVRWFGAGGFKIYSAMASADVPRKDKDLSVSMAYDKVLKPGQKARWALKARDAYGRPVNGEGTVRVFDRSLEYYQADAGFWTDSLYPKRESSSAGCGSLFTPRATSMPIKAGIIKTMFDLFRRGMKEEREPAFRIRSSIVNGFSRGGKFMAKSLDMTDEMSAPMSRSAGSGAPRGGEFSLAGGAAGGALKIKGAPSPAEAPVQVRKDFSETAYFNPRLKVIKGLGKFAFTIPERLTSWKIVSCLITRDIKRGKISAETVTKKDLMVRLDIPRFFREGDKSVLTAVINNESSAELSGEAAISVTLEGSAAENKFELNELSKPFSIKAGGTVALRWAITAPAGTAVYKIRAVARSGNLSDAQENDLPVLPSRERLIAAVNAALDGKGVKELELRELGEKDGTRVVESLHLEVQPQLILTVLNSLPFLVHYPYECTEQLLNRYVPLAITNSFYNRYPELKKAVANIPKRTTLTPAWERDNPARTMTLMETPWEEASKGEKAYWPAIDMLDPKVVSAEKEDAIEKLKSYQNGDGSFPWFPGGHPDLYMTLYALEGLAEAARYNVAIPEDVARKALGYVLAEIPRHMKAEEGQTSLILYAAYVVTSLPENWREHKTALSYAKLWADFADKYSNAMTPFGKAYAAHVYMRLGERKKAESYLARAMDGSREDDIAGLYWAPEKISWLWYNDTVEKHAFILRTLLALKPKDPRISGMVKWLLFSRKAGEWKSTRASAGAIYSLLDVMKSRGALDKEEGFKIKWGDVSDKVTLQPFDWASKPLRWAKYAPGITGGDISATIEKTGPGLAYASLTGIYTTDKLAGESPAGMMNISRKYFLRMKEGENYVLKPLVAGDTVSVGDQIEVQLTIATRSQFEYVHIKDPRGAGFEAEELLSGWKWDQLSRYEEPRDSLTNFFLDWLPHGEYILKYRVRPTTPGTYRIGAAVMQSMYAPEFAAHSTGMTLIVK